MISMLIGLEVSSLACKCVYFTDQNIMQEGEPMKLNFEGLKLQKWNIPTDEKVPIDRKVDEKNGVICLVTMFPPGVMVIKMSKMAHFLYFCWQQQKFSHSLGKTFKCTWKIFLSSFRKWYG